MLASFLVSSRLVSLYAVLVFLAAPASAQLSNFDKVGEQFAKKLNKSKSSVVAVADFTSTSGVVNGQGEYLAQFLTLSIQRHAKEKLRIADHAAFKAALEKRNISPASLSSPQSLQQLASQVRLDIIVTGTIEQRGDTYFVQATALHVPDAAIIDSQSASIHGSNFFDELAKPFPAKTDYPVFKAGVDGVTTPGCIYCPDPPYTDEARKCKIQGTSVFKVLVSMGGRAVQFRPIAVTGYGLDESAVDKIKTWRLKPATDKTGTPVAVTVDIEVSFRLN